MSSPDDISKLRKEVALLARFKFGFTLVHRHMVNELSATEQRLLYAILDRTLGWNRRINYISESQFLHGVGDEDELHAAPVGLSKSALYKARAVLIDRNMIRLHDKRYGGIGYEINLDWNTGEHDLGPALLPEGEESVNEESPVGDKTVSVGRLNSLHRETIQYNNIDKDRNIVRTRTHEAVQESVNSMTTLSPRDAALAAIASATAKGVAARGKKKAKGNATSYEMIWRDAYLSAYPEEKHFPWTMIVKAAFKKALDRGVPDDDREAFISFVVTDFTKILASHFKGLRTAPAYPVPMFVAKLVTTFWQAFEDNRNPNRQLDARIAGSQRRTVEPIAPVTPSVTDAEVAKLRKRNEQLEAALKVERQDKAVHRQKKIRRLALPKRRDQLGDDEFKWRDDD